MAARGMHQEFHGVVSDPHLPRGCFFDNEELRYNENFFGYGSVESQPVCFQLDPNAQPNMLRPETTRSTTSAATTSPTPAPTDAPPVAPAPLPPAPDMSDTSAADAEAAEQARLLREQEEKLFLAGGVGLGVIGAIVFFVIRRRKAQAEEEAEKAAEEAAKAKAGSGGEVPLGGESAEERWPVVGDYVFVASTGRNGVVSSVDEENWLYVVTYEDDGTQSPPLPHTDVKLYDVPDEAGGTEATPAAAVAETEPSVAAAAEGGGGGG